jgi:hypothetical protein
MAGKKLVSCDYLQQRENTVARNQRFDFRYEQAKLPTLSCKQLIQGKLLA